MAKISCPACSHPIPIRKTSPLKELVTCPQCAAIFEVINTKPLALGWPEDPQIPSARRIFHNYI